MATGQQVVVSVVVNVVPVVILVLVATMAVVSATSFLSNLLLITVFSIKMIYIGLTQLTETRP